MRTIFATAALSALLAAPALLWGAPLPAAVEAQQTQSEPALPVPEPQPLLYVGVGLLVLAVVVRRRRPTAQKVDDSQVQGRSEGRSTGAEAAAS